MVKKILVFFFLLSACQVQKKYKPIPQVYCDSLFFDLETGMINNISPMLSQEEIKEWFPCYTKVSPQGASQDCGGGILYGKHDFYYYTYFDFIEVRENFKGKTSYDLLGKTKEEVRKFLGEPVETKYLNERPEIDFFFRNYGCLRIQYRDNKVILISAHYTECGNVEVCNY